MFILILLHSEVVLVSVPMQNLPEKKSTSAWAHGTGEVHQTIELGMSNLHISPIQDHGRG